MRKVYFKKALSIILLFVVMIAALGVTVSARYQYTSGVSASINIDSSGLATCNGVVKPSDSSTNTTVTVELQKKSGSSWVKEASWSSSSTGTKTATCSNTRYVVRGTYRVVTTGKVYSSSGTLLETTNVTSQEVTY